MALDTSSSEDGMSDIKIRSRITKERQNYTCIYDKSNPAHSRCDRKIEIYEAIGLLVSLTCK